MNKFYSLYIALGRLLYLPILPLMRLFIKRTHRTYVFILRGDKVLLVKNWLGDGRWALPGGGVRNGESNEVAIKREVQEELGLMLDTVGLRHVANGCWQDHNLGFNYDLYAIKADVKIRSVRKLEITEAAWVGLASLSNSSMAIDLINGLANLNQSSLSA